MKLRELLSFVANPLEDFVSVYHTITDDCYYRDIYEGTAANCPDNLFERPVIEIFASEEKLCVCIDIDEEYGMEEIGVIRWTDESGEHKVTKYADFDGMFFVKVDGELVDFFDFFDEHIHGPYTIGPR